MGDLKVGVIGCGSIAQRVHIPGLLSCEGVKIAATCDPMKKNLEAVAPVTPGAKRLSNYKDVLKDKSIAAVIVATPNNLHCEVAKAALKAGKHVLLEKPIAVDLASARDLWETAEKSGLVNMTAFTYRFVPGIRFLKHVAERGELGKVYQFLSRYLIGGLANPKIPMMWRKDKSQAGAGVIGDLGTHTFDFARHLNGEIDSVCATTKIFIKKRKDPVTGEDREVQTDDYGSILCEFKNGSAGVIEVSLFATGHQEDQYIEINGSGGAARYDFVDFQNLELCLGPISLEANCFSKVEIPRPFRYVPGGYSRVFTKGDPYVQFRYEQARTFIQGIQTGQQVAPSLYDGYMAQAVLEACLESAKKRRWVKVEL